MLPEFNFMVPRSDLAPLIFSIQPSFFHTAIRPSISSFEFVWFLKLYVGCKSIPFLGILQSFGCQLKICVIGKWSPYFLFQMRLYASSWSSCASKKPFRPDLKSMIASTILPLKSTQATKSIHPASLSSSSVIGNSRATGLTCLSCHHCLKLEISLQSFVFLFWYVLFGVFWNFLQKLFITQGWETMGIDSDENSWIPSEHFHTLLETFRLFR